MTTRNQERTEELRNKRISRLLLAYALPAVVGTMANALYNVIDRIFIGRGVDEFAIAGLVLTFPILVLLQAFGMLVGSGASVRVSILLGQNNVQKANKVLTNAVFMTLVLSIATIIPALVYMEPLLRLFGASDRTLPYAMDYLVVVIPGNILGTLSFSYNSVMRASGYPKKAMIQMIMGACINIVLDAVFIYGFGWGIQGAAWATVISQFVTVVYVVFHFGNKRNLVHVDPSSMKISWNIIKSILAIGIAPFTLQVVGSLTNIIMNRSFIKYGGANGDLAIGTYGVLNSFALLIIMLAIGVAQGMQPIVGFNYGAGQIKRVLSTYKICIITNSIICCVGAIITLLFPEPLVRLFTTSESLIAVSVPAMRIVFSVFFVNGIQITSAQFFQSLGHAKEAMFLSLTRQVLFLIPMLLILPPFMGLDGVWASMPIADVLAAIVAALMVSYQLRILKRQVQPI